MHVYPSLYAHACEPCTESLAVPALEGTRWLLPSTTSTRGAHGLKVPGQKRSWVSETRIEDNGNCDTSGPECLSHACCRAETVLFKNLSSFLHDSSRAPQATQLRFIQPDPRRNVAHRDVKGDNYLMDRKACTVSER